MPIYSLQCEECGYTDDYTISFKDNEKCRVDDNKYDFKDVCECPKCSSTKFIKKVVAHGRMACNWEKWNVPRK